MTDTKNLKILGQSGATKYPSNPEEACVETFDNPASGKDYDIVFETQEFTSLCPVTSQPDFARIRIAYVPYKKCIESKSLKLYLYSFRNHRAFAESLVNRILDDLVNISEPVKMTVEGFFTSRGGITINVKAEHKKEI